LATRSWSPERIVAQHGESPDGYPLALVPLYAVPVSLILHGLVWQRLAARTSDMVVHSLAE
jgi:hypothetical protein